MNSDRTHFSRSIDYSAIANGKRQLRNMIVHFIHGIKNARENEVSTLQIIRWFRATPMAFIHAAIDQALDDSLITIGRRALMSKGNHRDAYYYEPTHEGLCVIFPEGHVKHPQSEKAPAAPAGPAGPAGPAAPAQSRLDEANRLYSPYGITFSPRKHPALDEVWIVAQKGERKHWERSIDDAICYVDEFMA